MTSYVCYNNNRGNLEIEVQLAQKGRKDLVADQNEDLRDVLFLKTNLFLLVTLPKLKKTLHLSSIFHIFQLLIKEHRWRKIIIEVVNIKRISVWVWLYFAVRYIMR